MKPQWRRSYPGILSWAIQGALDWKKHGLLRPNVVHEATNDYFADQDTFGRWLNDCCELHAGFSDTTEALWTSWQRYAWDQGEEPGSKTRTFPETLKQRGFNATEKVGANRLRGFKGIRLDPGFDNDADEIT